MNVQLINCDKNLINSFPAGDNILEIRASEMNSHIVELTLFMPEHRQIIDIAPEIIKYDFLPVFNCIYNSPDIYFASFENISEDRLKISVYKYDVSSYSSSCILDFEERNITANKDISIKIFIVSANYIIVQSEFINKETNELMGNIEFTQILYNLENGEVIRGTNINLINNGINYIIPVSETHFMVKSGFSPIEDPRINPSSENEALIESLYYCSISMFISSLSIDNATVGYSLLGTAYFETSILNARITDDYIYFSIYDHLNKSCETTFYNFKNDETIKCVNNDVSSDSAANAFVIDNIPYIRNTFIDRTEFFNVSASESDCVFYGEDFITLIGNLFVFSDKNKINNSLRIYRYPKSDLIYTGRGSFINGCLCNDNYYFYINQD